MNRKKNKVNSKGVERVKFRKKEKRNSHFNDKKKNRGVLIMTQTRKKTTKTNILIKT